MTLPLSADDSADAAARTEPSPPTHHQALATRLARFLRGAPQMKLHRRATVVGDSRGATLVEYMMVVGCVGLVALGGYRVFGSSAVLKAEAQARCVESFDCAPGSPDAATPLHGLDPNALAPQLASGPPGWGEVPGGKDATYEEIPGEPTITGEGDANEVHPNDVTQGMIGDCFVMTAMAAIAQGNPDIIKNAIKDNGDGTYTVTFHEKAAWYDPFDSGYHDVQITVTGEFPATDGNPVFAQPGDMNGDQRELWPMILEKAYAQYAGGYDEIAEGGQSADVLALLTGRDVDQNGGRRLEEWFGWDVEFDEVADAWDRGAAITAGTSGDKELPLFKDGTLVTKHAYYVTNVDRDNQTVTVRNPWGWGLGETTLSFEDFRNHFTGMSSVPLR
ncbi:MAG: C2 family cysteine protease [Polyangiaceae bacterium]